MRKSFGIVAVVLGTCGTLVCLGAIGLGWWAASKTVDRVDHLAARLDSGLAETDVRLARVEARVSTLRAELHEVRGSAEAIVAENPELPRVRAEIERLFDKLTPTLERVDATADSLRSVAAGLRAAADLVDQLKDDRTATARVRQAADAIDRAAEALDLPQNKIDAVKSAKAVEVTRGLVKLVKDAIAGSDLLAEGLAAARRESAEARVGVVEYRDFLTFRIYAATAAHTLLWVWAGLGQLCLIAWGRRRLAPASPGTSISG